MICSLAFAACLAQSQVAADCIAHIEQATALKAVRPKLPASARNFHGSTTVLVEVTIDEHGTAASATIYKSSGRADLDRAALVAARASQYAPQLVDCHPVTADYLFRAEFNGFPATVPQTPVPSPAPSSSR